ncbi:MarR family winged helix-turn-helix transcriptional regulator [Polynucleobacter sp. Tro8-14-1]|uniref:MarR family winged helix-turn-helix transcriptional regulator n=1 Tax=Polynucleobacter sp. Tro8-14-1 TaxID=1758383 RepID=UPI001C0C3F53|nr:MarR family winged helix-turn-helix transcriptional regulator [Polynucleobacter sp. Tro8-14-1]MBU3564210.1 winged helix-turn-helix transcriptional regulator [Polynucleobacter sp. Tro8-14-1]
MSSQSYLMFLEASNKLWAGITSNQREVLLAVIKRDSSNPYRVQDIIGMRSIASQATLHKALTELVAQGYLAFKPSPSDNRVKFVVLARKGGALEARLTKILSQACE